MPGGAGIFCAGMTLTNGAGFGGDADYVVAPIGEVTALPATLTFTPANWFMPQEVTVFAIDDAVVDGGDIKVFAPQLKTVALVQGPLLIKGGGGVGSLGVIGPLMLPGELNIKPPTGDVQAITTLLATTLRSPSASS